jgi:DNA-directed RNA polymerase subunit M/transcription elongation factor TFIIS
MNFCKECDNILSPVEEDSKLLNKCSNCGFKEEYQELVIDRKNYKNKDSISLDSNKFLIYDPTIPRTIQKTCPNKDCISIKKPELQEAIFIQDPITIKLRFICVNCNTEWTYA